MRINPNQLNQLIKIKFKAKASKVILIGIIHDKCHSFEMSFSETEKVFLTKEELFNLYNLDLSDNNRLEKVRDIFCFGCFTGLRFSDISALKFLSIMTKQNVGGGEYQALNFNVYKTKDMLVVPLSKYSLKKK